MCERRKEWGIIIKTKIFNIWRNITNHSTFKKTNFRSIHKWHDGVRKIYYIRCYVTTASEPKSASQLIWKRVNNNFQCSSRASKKCKVNLLWVLLYMMLECVSCLHSCVFVAKKKTTETYLCLWVCECTLEMHLLHICIIKKLSEQQQQHTDMQFLTVSYVFLRLLNGVL